ncbi:MAG: DUF1573 domain-containing protein [Chitinophagaceae bacterium]|nr:MAG: DUF1573 domain-containing protein [Chitinophagaceae bacterium]
MKKILFSLMAVAVTTFAVAQTKVADVAEFKAETIDLGKMKVNNATTATFVVKNIGTTPLIIEAANPTCGCTIGDYTKAPIAPGKTGQITATYNAATIGTVQKSMNVKFAGIDEVKNIHFTGEVLSEEDFAKLAPSPAKANAKTAKKATPAKKSK